MSTRQIDLLDEQLREQRRMVDFDTFDIQLQELIRMLADKQIAVAPAYQRLFRWDNARCSQLIESLMLGIPIPNLFMATNVDNTWEVVDGVQRISAIVKFAADDNLRSSLGLNGALMLEDLQKIDHFNGFTFESLPSHIQQHIRTRPLRVVTLNDKSDSVVRFDLFERLNTGGITLTNQEIRDCVYRGPFADLLKDLSNDPNFIHVVKLTSKQKRDGTSEECVLRFFAFLDNYKNFDHSVVDFLNDYMNLARVGFNHLARAAEFTDVFMQLSNVFPDGIKRPGRQTTTPLNLYEGVAVGAALAIKRNRRLVADGLEEWMASAELRTYTTGATNSKRAVRGRIEFCRDRFLGRPYVPAVAE